MTTQQQQPGGRHLPWAVVQDEYGNVGIVNAIGDYIVEEIATVQDEAALDAELIVTAVNATQLNNSPRRAN